jgi:hypothetical protein
MPLMREQFSKLEGQLEKLFEGSLARLLGDEISTSSLAAQLARTLSDGVRRDDAGRAYAPNEFALTLHPEDAKHVLKQAPDIQSTLSNGLGQVATDCGYALAQDPTITLATDPTLGRREVRVISWHSSNPLEFTQSMVREPRTSTGVLPKGAFLILDDGRHFSLDRPVINVGRRIDNQIILEEPHVSRTHAQLRVREGRFVLFDLGSTGGTQVNGRKVKQHILRPGDVITIAKLRLVYGEDPGGPPDTATAYTPPFPPRPAGDQRTVTGGWDKNKGQ